MKTILKSVAMVAMMSALSGCVTARSIRVVQDNDKRPITLVQTIDEYTYVPYIYKMNKHQFWSCAQTGDALDCTPSCGGNTDLTCPAGQAMVVGRGSNVR